MVVALVVYALTRPSPPERLATPAPTPPSVVAALADVPPSTFDTVGAQVTAKPTPAHRHLDSSSANPGSSSSGKPEVLFVGRRVLPVLRRRALAAHRRPVAVRPFQRAARHAVGGQLGLRQHPEASASRTPSFQSPYLSFVGVELYSDELNPDGTYMRIASLTPRRAPSSTDTAAPASRSNDADPLP